MSTPLLISLIAFGWLLTAVAVAFPVARFLSLSGEPPTPLPPKRQAGGAGGARAPDGPARKHVLIVDDDEGLRVLLRTTFEGVQLRVDEADSAAAAAREIAADCPDVVVLDVGMPGMDGATFCRRLKADPQTKHVPVVLLTGADDATEAAAEQAGANGFLRKPFSPLTLLRLIERVSGEGAATHLHTQPADEAGQLMLYARDLRHLLDLERGQRRLLQNAYRETATALSRALESKDTGTGVHSQRVQRYATELIAAIDPELAANPSIEYGFLLHDIGKIGIPDRILLKRDGLTQAERRVLETHSALGQQMLADVVLLRSRGLEVVRSHHERWDGRGYPDRLRAEEIPVAARVFAVADTLDAMTTDRPYRRAGSWTAASAEIVSQAGRQFDPAVVQAFCDVEPRLRELSTQFPAAREVVYSR